jgi:hypothetical protein
VSKSRAVAVTAAREGKSLTALDLRELYCCLARSAPCCTSALVSLTGNPANEVAGSGRVAIIHTPKNGQPAEAKLSSDEMIHAGRTALAILLSDGQPEGFTSSTPSKGAGVAGVLDKTGRLILFQ